MYVEEVTFTNQVGLNARPATHFNQLVCEFKSDVWIQKKELRVNAKDLFATLSLKIAKGDTVQIFAIGEDEVSAVTRLCELIKAEFDFKKFDFTK